VTTIAGLTITRSSFQEPDCYDHFSQSLRNTDLCRPSLAPCTLIFELAVAISRRSWEVSSIATAPRFSSRRSSLRVPGIGTIHGF
jgi:hypothetical protein